MASLKKMCAIILLTFIGLLDCNNLNSKQRKSAQRCTKTGVIALLNGTSAAGKSSIIKALQMSSGNAFFVTSFDDFIKTYDKEVRTQLDIAERDDAFYQHIKDSSKIYDKVLVDAIDHETVFEKYDDFLGQSLIKILVYCPLPDLAKRIEKRNHQHEYKNEHLKLFLTFTQFLSLYTMQTSLHEPIIDTIRAANIKNMLRQIKKELHEFDSKHPELDPQYFSKSVQERAEQYNDLVQSATALFQFNDHKKIKITARQNIWDFVINSGKNSPQAAARKIANFLETKD